MAAADRSDGTGAIGRRPPCESALLGVLTHANGTGNITSINRATKGE